MDWVTFIQVIALIPWTIMWLGIGVAAFRHDPSTSSEIELP